MPQDDANNIRQGSIHTDDVRSQQTISTTPWTTQRGRFDAFMKVPWSRAMILFLPTAMSCPEDCERGGIPEQAARAVLWRIRKHRLIKYRDLQALI